MTGWGKKIDWCLETNGSGLYTRYSGLVRMTYISWAPIHDSEFGELKVWFSPKAWKVKERSYIYTDELWLVKLRRHLHLFLGYSERASHDVDYSELGMQAFRFVSLDTGPLFHRENDPYYRWAVLKESIS